MGVDMFDAAADFAELLPPKWKGLGLLIVAVAVAFPGPFQSWYYAQAEDHPRNSRAGSKGHSCPKSANTPIRKHGYGRPSRPDARRLYP
jgi:hypothetical protein